MALYCFTACDVAVTAAETICDTTVSYVSPPGRPRDVELRERQQCRITTMWNVEKSRRSACDESLWSLRCFTVHGGDREPREPLTPRFKPSTAEYPAAAPLSTAPKIRGDRGRETGFRTGTEQKNFHGWKFRSQDAKRGRELRAWRARFDKRIYLRVAFSRNRTLLGNVYKQRLFQRARVLLLL